MGLFDFLRGSSTPARRRRRREPTERERMQRRYAEHKRKQARQRQGAERQRTTERERAERQAQTERQRTTRRDVTLALRAERAQARELARLKRAGWSDAEARQMLEDRDNYVDVNPTGRRLAHALTVLGLAAIARNPQLGSSDPASMRASERFHGTARDAATLSDRERHTTPRDVVVVGQLESIAYKPLRGSSRASSVWLHEIGDRGWLQPRAKRKPLLVADPRTGRADIVGGSMRFEPDRGLVG